MFLSIRTIRTIRAVCRARLFAAVAIAFSMQASAATAFAPAENAMRPGLWEVSTTSPLLKLVPQVSPDQMAKLRQLAGQYGVGMPDISSGAATGKVCVSAAMARQNLLPGLDQARSGCRSHNARRSGSHYRAEVTCAGPNISGSGTAQGDFTTPESFTGSSRFQGIVQGIPVDEHAETSGRWISADCAGLKAMQ